MPRFGPDRDRPTLNDVQRAAASEGVTTLSDLAARLSVTQDRARTLAMDAAVYDDLTDDTPRDGGEEA